MMLKYCDPMIYEKTETSPINSMNTVSIKRITDEEFSAMQDGWNELLERSATNEVFLSWEWMFSWWSAFKDDGKKLFILAGKDSRGNLVGIAPFYIERRAYFGVKNQNIVGFCSSFDTAPDHLDILCDKEFSHHFPSMVFTYLQKHNAEWDEIRFEGIKDNSVIKNYLMQNRERLHHLIIECDPQSGCPYLSINQSFEEYLNSFSRKTRNTLSRKKRLLLEKEQYEYRIVSSNALDLEKNMRELFSLHAERAKRKNFATAFGGEKVYRFHEGLIAYLLKEDKIVISSLSKGSVSLTFYYCIKHNNKYYYYQTGISERGEEKSAGTVLLSLMIERAFKEGCTEFDFLRGDEKYKYFWTNNTRFNFSMYLRKNSLLNRIAHHLSRSFIKPGKRMIKKCIR